MTLHFLVVESIPVALGLLPYAICVALWARRYTADVRYNNEECLRAIARAQGYRSSQVYMLGAILRELEWQRIQVPYTPSTAQPVANLPPQTQYTQDSEPPSDQWSPSQLSKLRRHLDNFVAGEIRLPLPAAQPSQSDSFSEGFIEDTSQEPEISHGGE